MSITNENVLGTNFVCQIAMVVHDAVDACNAFAEILGVPKPATMMANEDLSDRVTFRGSPSDGRVRLGFFFLANTVVEFIEPTADATTWKEHLDGRGPGIHHIAFKAKPFAARIDALVAHGYPLVQRGNRYAYVDSERLLGFIWEPLDIPDPVCRPPLATGTLGTDRIARVASVVRNLAATMAAYQELMGFAGSRVEHSDADSSVQPAPLGLWEAFLPCRVARLAMGNLKLEFVEQTHEGENLIGGGPRLHDGGHHIAFEVSDLETRVARLSAMGYPTEARGEGWALIDTTPRLGTRLALTTA